MRERYYYLRRDVDGNSHKCGIVFLIRKEDYTARGVSLCNEDEDNFIRDPGFIFDKKIGRIIPFEGGLRKARRRALRALNARKNSGAINLQKAVEKTYWHGILFKSTFNPSLTDFEKAILEGGR